MSSPEEVFKRIYSDTSLEYMVEYSKAFTDGSKIFFEPYVMYTNPKNYRSSVVNTDKYGLRWCNSIVGESCNEAIENEKSYDVFLGSSTVFGFGSSCDNRTLPGFYSQSTGVPTINLGGRSYNTTQELMSFIQFQSRTNSKPRRLISFTGFNDLALSNLTLSDNNQAYFMQNIFNEQISRSSWFKKSIFSLNEKVNAHNYAMEERLSIAIDAVKIYIDFLSSYCDKFNIEYVFCLQPLFNWVEKKPTKDESLVFSRMEELGSFEKIFGELTNLEVYQAYEVAIREYCQLSNVKFISITELLRNECATESEESLFVNRINLTDSGNKLVSDLILKNILNLRF